MDLRTVELIFGKFFFHQIPGLIFGWAYFQVGLFSVNYRRIKKQIKIKKFLLSILWL